MNTLDSEGTVNDNKDPLSSLSLSGQVWAKFFKIETPERAGLLISLGVIKANIRPGFTETRFEEIKKWSRELPRGKDAKVIALAAINGVKEPS